MVKTFDVRLLMGIFLLQKLNELSFTTGSLSRFGKKPIKFISYCFCFGITSLLIKGITNLKNKYTSTAKMIWK
jgi:hypothetical protein